MYENCFNSLCTSKCCWPNSIEFINTHAFTSLYLFSLCFVFFFFLSISVCFIILSDYVFWDVRTWNLKSAKILSSFYIVGRKNEGFAMFLHFCLPFYIVVVWFCSFALYFPSHALLQYSNDFVHMRNKQ